MLFIQETNVKNLVDARRELAEKGIELTPKELIGHIKQLKKIQQKLLNSDLCSMTLWDKQNLCRKLAAQGTEISPVELDEIIEIATKICAKDFGDK